ncbi:hypothetical protein AB0L05_19830 [Nonomuraea pusilla]|uniref:hypothetical protein n=1 Tax=Nonomuraea pusilla TaxID=46177 RepID=UPI00331E57B4
MADGAALVSGLRVAGWVAAGLTLVGVLIAATLGAPRQDDPAGERHLASTR